MRSPPGPGRSVPDGADSPHSHESLLGGPALLRPAAGSLSAVVVPTARAGGELRHAAQVAAFAGCPLLLLCSRGVRAAEALESLAGSPRPSVVVAVDVTLASGYGTVPLNLRTDSVAATAYGREVDTPRKRNLALVVAHLLDWSSVLFLDDDVFGLTAGDLQQARKLLASDTLNGPVGAVGWSFPSLHVADGPCIADNSVVYHARREADDEPGTFLGGGGLIVRRDSGTPFFPAVYNDDWLFFFDLLARGRVLLAGDLCQRYYDPFADPAVAAHQEFGDLLAEALYTLLPGGAERYEHDPGRITALLAPAFTLSWWRDRIEERCRLIETIHRHPAVRGREDVVRSLTVARTSHETSWAAELVEYVRAWRADLTTWYRVVVGAPAVRVPGVAGLCAALRRLELEPLVLDTFSEVALDAQ